MQVVTTHKNTDFDALASVIAATLLYPGSVSILRSLGGGGHPNAGAALVKSVDADMVEDRINELIKGGQRASAQISDLMSFPVFTVADDTPMDEVARILREKGCTGLPVVKNGSLVGIITRSDAMLYFYDLLPG